jgi:hypothetical protein
MGWRDLPYQWTTAGYSGAIRSGKTICGELFGATAFLGAIYGVGGPRPPAVDDARRRQAIDAVGGLYRGFIERFGNTECAALTGCDWTSEQGMTRFQQEQVFERHCCRQLEHVLAVCLDKICSLSANPEQPVQA